MAKIGNWGRHIKFSVNSEKVLSFKDFKRTVKGRWADHLIINEKPKKEFQGPDASSVTMDVVLSAHLGVSPKDTIEKLEKACEKGKIEYLYIGGKKVGKCKMYLESVSETWDEIWNKGELARATLSLTFTEYS